MQIDVVSDYSVWYFSKVNSSISSSWFICTISKEGFKNWEICKEISAWGIAASGERKPRLDRVVKGDHLIIYAAGKGFLSTAIVTSPMRRPLSHEEAPWPGGVYRYGAIVPFKILIETKNPLKISLTKMVFDGTEIHTSRLQKGFSMISGHDGNFLYQQMKRNLEFEKLESKKSNKK